MTQEWAIEKETKQKGKPIESRVSMKSREEKVAGNGNCSLKYHWKSEWRKWH